MQAGGKLTTRVDILLLAVEVAKQGGPFTARDLYPFQLALYQIDSLRKDGKFEGRDGSVPEGQAILNALLSEAHESEPHNPVLCMNRCIWILTRLVFPAHSDLDDAGGGHGMSCRTSM